MLIFLFIILGIAIVGLIASLLALFFLFKTRVPFVRTPHETWKTIIEQVPPQHGLRVTDIGCGDASMLFALEAARPDLRLDGYELAPWPYVLSRFKRWLKKSKVQLYYRDFYTVDLSQYDVIFCFLIAGVMPKLEKKLRQELKPGAMVISYGFTFPSWQPAQVIDNPSKRWRSKINIYKQS